MPSLSREDFQALYSLEREAGSGQSVAELRHELSLTFPREARVLMRGSEDYPQALEALADPPRVLCALGDLGLLERQLLVSIVGSRNALPERCESASFVASDLAARGAVIVSGLAAGIDRAAHEGALAAWTNESRPGRTIAVLGTPLSFPWPPENAKLYEEVVATGLALSEAPQAEGRRFDPNERARSLKRRNRIVAALGTGTLVMAAAPGSSTLIEVDYCLGMRRPVILWHECAQEPWAQELLSKDLRDGDGRALVAVARNAVDVEEILSPWSRVWWL